AVPAVATSTTPTLPSAALVKTQPPKLKASAAASVAPVASAPPVASTAPPKAKLPSGAPCARGAECASGYCFAEQCQ
ncbi:MAG: hypothetical protein ACXWUG_31950, partial [Polyangiales bacterium]